jgi:hypothetical protein
MEMKKRIYIFVLMVLLLAALPQLALAAAPSPVASVACDYRSHVIPYPTAAIDTGSADCLADYAIPYPAADFEGDGISYFVRSPTIDSSADTDVYSDSSFAGYAIPYPALGGDSPSISIGYVLPYPSAADPAKTAPAR